MAYPIRDSLSPELSWTHYRRLMRIENEKTRAFYTEECIKSGWSVRQLDRQINSFFYERLLSSQDKKVVSDEIQSLEPKSEYEKIAVWRSTRNARKGFPKSVLCFLGKTSDRRRLYKIMRKTVE